MDGCRRSVLVRGGRATCWPTGGSAFLLLMCDERFICVCVSSTRNGRRWLMSLRTRPLQKELSNRRRVLLLRAARALLASALIFAFYAAAVVVLPVLHPWE